MRKLFALGLALLLNCTAWAADDDGQKPDLEPSLKIDGYARETLPGSAMSAAYLLLNNTGDADLSLQGVELREPEGAADLHTTAVGEDGISRMRPLAALVIPAGTEVRMAPGATHLMLRGVMLHAGDTLPLRLRFAGGGVLDIEVPVRSLKAESGEHDHHHG